MQVPSECAGQVAGQGFLLKPGRCRPGPESNLHVSVTDWTLLVPSSIWDSLQATHVSQHWSHAIKNSKTVIKMHANKICRFYFHSYKGRHMTCFRAELFKCYNKMLISDELDGWPASSARHQNITIMDLLKTSKTHWTGHMQLACLLRRGWPLQRVTGLIWGALKWLRDFLIIFFIFGCSCNLWFWAFELWSHRHLKHDKEPQRLPDLYERSQNKKVGNHWFNYLDCDVF